MIRICLFFVLLPCALCLTPARAAGDAPPAPTTYARDFGDVCALIEKHFYDDKHGGLDWPAVRDRYARRAQAAQSDAQFLALTNEMLGLLHASHTRLYGPDDFPFYFLPELSLGPPLHGPPPGAPFVVRLLPDTALHAQIGCLMRQDAPDTVAAVLDGSPAARAGLTAGDVLLSVDGEPFHGLTQFGRAPARVVFRRRGQEQSATLTPVLESPTQMLLEATLKSVRVIPQPGGRRIGYLHLWATATPAFLAALDSAGGGDLHDTDGLILDLRQGFGGSPDGYGDVFFRPDLEVRRRGHGQAEWVTSHEGYAKPVVALIDGGTRSAKEWVAWRLHASGRATLVGERTAGAVLAEMPFRVGDRFLLELAVQDLQVGGVRLEGRGVAPDVAVPAGTDEAGWLRAALRALSRKPRP